MENRGSLLPKITGILALVGAVAKIISVLVGANHANTYVPPPIEILRPGPQSEQDKIDEEKRRAFFQSISEMRKQSGLDSIGPEAAQSGQSK